MVSLLPQSRYGPIGVDIGTRSVKLLQMDAARTRVHEVARWDLPSETPPNAERLDELIVEALHRAREGREFRGRKAVLTLGADDLFVQNLRVPQASGDELAKIVHYEAAGRLPFPREEAEMRFIETADVRQGDAVRREVILLATQRARIERLLSIAERAALMPVAIDIEPAALLRAYSKQYRRDDDQQRIMMFVNIGVSTTTVLTARGTNAMFLKYIQCGGRDFDRAVSEYLRIPLPDAMSLRRHNGDRRADQRDPEVTKSINEAIRPVLDQLGSELALCLRYHSVTFRGQSLDLAVLGGGEGSDGLAQWLAARMNMPWEMGDPLRSFTAERLPGRAGQWDVAAGLALKDIN